MKNTSEQVEAIKAFTGVKIMEDKNISAMNSLKHGGTARHLINDEEKNRHKHLIDALKNQYPSKNPLIEIQIERIARTTIQLERIQNTIDATFKKARATSNIVEGLMKTLNMTPIEESLAAKSMLGLPVDDLIINDERLSVSIDLADINLITPKTSQEFLERAPKFCQYIYEEAKSKKLSVSDFITQKIPGGSISEGGVLRRYIFITGVQDKDEIKIKSIEEEILATDVTELQNAAAWLVKEISRVGISTQKIVDFKKLLSSEEESIMPDLDQTDRLMRYQTTLQRQLSTSIGELLALTKN